MKGHIISILQLRLKLNRSLVGPDMVVADEYEVLVSYANVSWGRVIDGAASSTTSTFPPRG